MSLLGKVAFVTGGARGLGKGYTQGLLRQKAKVCFIDLNEEEGTRSLSELQSEFGADNVNFFVCDVTNAANFEAAFKKAIGIYGRIDIMVNNAGVICENDWEKCIDINFTAVARGTMLAMNHMRIDSEGKGGIILNISSVTAFGTFKFIPAYCSTKHAVLAYTKCWREYSEHAKLGVRVVCLCPDLVDTPILNLKPGSTFDNTFRDTYEGEHSILTVDDMVVSFLKLVLDKDDNSGVMQSTKEGAAYV